jgi:hypothetical protein
VLLSDTTFGLSSRNSGFPKHSIWVSVDSAHYAHLLAFIMIQSEDRDTFDFECRLMLSRFPSLATAVFVLLVDGDRQKMEAARAHFANVCIILCFFHCWQNVKKHLQTSVNAFLEWKARNPGGGEDITDADMGVSAGDDSDEDACGEDIEGTEERNSVWEGAKYCMCNVSGCRKFRCIPEATWTCFDTASPEAERVV